MRQSPRNREGYVASAERCLCCMPLHGGCSRSQATGSYAQLIRMTVEPTAGIACRGRQSALVCMSWVAGDFATPALREQLNLQWQWIYSCLCRRSGGDGGEALQYMTQRSLVRSKISRACREPRSASRCGARDRWSFCGTACRGRF